MEHPFFSFERAGTVHFINLLRIERFDYTEEKEASLELAHGAKMTLPAKHAKKLAVILGTMSQSIADEEPEDR